jgi:hypothetical protein
MFWVLLKIPIFMKFQIFIKEYVFITSPQPSYLPVRQAGSRGGRTASPKYRIQPAGKVVFSPQSIYVRKA